MPMTTKERTDLRQELVGQGYSWKYIDEWPTKTTLYWHRDNGVKAVGTPVSGVPGNPDYVSKKARTGLLQWPPSEACTCRWCLGRRGSDSVATRQVEGVVEDINKDAPSVVPQAQARGGRRMGPHFQQS